MSEVKIPSELMSLKRDVLGQLVRQLEKDFALSGVSKDFSEATEPVKMWQVVLSALHDLLKNDPESLRNLLYRVDVNEGSVNALVTDKEASTFLIELTRQVIVRELQKIINRMNYESG